MQLHQVTWLHSGCRMLENHSPFISFKSALIKRAISVLTNITFFYFFSALILVFYTWLQGGKNQVVIIVLKTRFEVTGCLPKAAPEMSDTQYDVGGGLFLTWQPRQHFSPTPSSLKLLLAQNTETRAAVGISPATSRVTMIKALCCQLLGLHTPHPGGSRLLGTAGPRPDSGDRRHFRW